MSSDLNAVNNIFRSFCTKAVIFDADSNSREVACLRNTGSAQTLISKQLIKPSEYEETGEYRLI